MAHLFSPHSRFAKSLMIVGLMLTLAGCVRQTPPPTTMTGLKDSTLQEQTKEQLEAFAATFEAAVDKVATDIELRTTNRSHERATAMWRTHMVPACQGLARQEPTPETVTELWVLCQRMSDYLATGEGSTLFGPYQPAATAAAQDILKRFETVPRGLLAPEAFDELRQEVLRIARALPMTNDFTVVSKPVHEDTALMATLKHIASMPMTPLNVLNGIGKAPESVRDVSASMDRFTAVAEDLPANARWQLKLLATELAETEPATKTLDNLTRLAGSAEELNRVAAAYPASVSKEVKAVLDDAVGKLPEVQKTVANVRETMALAHATTEEFRGSLADSQQLLGSVQEAAAGLTEAAGAVRLTAQEIQKFIPASKKDATGQIMGDPPATPPGSQKGPAPATAGNATDDSFSFQAVTASAVALQGAAREVRATLAELRELIGDRDVVTRQLENVGGRLDASTDKAAQRLEQATDHAAWRGAQLIALFFGLLVIYRLLFGRGKANAGTSPAGSVT